MLVSVSVLAFGQLQSLESHVSNYITQNFPLADLHGTLHGMLAVHPADVSRNSLRYMCRTRFRMASVIIVSNSVRVSISV